MINLASNSVQGMMRKPHPYVNQAQLAANQAGAGLSKAGETLKAPVNTTDSAQLSSLSRLLQKLKTGDAGTSLNSVADGKTPVSVADIRKMLQENSSRLQEQLAKLCKENNISLDTPFQLGLDKDGRIVVSGDNAQKEQIQNMLRSDDSFSKLFRETKGLSDFVTTYDKQAQAAA